MRHITFDSKTWLISSCFVNRFPIDSLLLHWCWLQTTRSTAEASGPKTAPQEEITGGWGREEALILSHPALLWIPITTSRGAELLLLLWLIWLTRLSIVNPDQQPSPLTQLFLPWPARAGPLCGTEQPEERTTPHPHPPFPRILCALLTV